MSLFCYVAICVYIIHIRKESLKNSLENMVRRSSLTLRGFLFLLLGYRTLLNEVESATDDADAIEILIETSFFRVI